MSAGPSKHGASPGDVGLHLSAAAAAPGGTSPGDVGLHVSAAAAVPGAAEPAAAPEDAEPAATAVRCRLPKCCMTMLKAFTLCFPHFATAIMLEFPRSGESEAAGSDGGG